MYVFEHYPPIDDQRSLKLLTEGYGDLKDSFNSISQAYGNYINSQGSPYILAVGLTKEEANCLHLAYESGAKKYNLQWIPSIREVLIGSCPMCGSANIGTVEHYLPKTPFPEFSVFSFNLVPSCSTCNQKRGSSHANGAVQKLLHPIFDREILFKLKIFTRFDTSEPLLSFELDYNKFDFAPDVQARVEAHLRMCIDRRAYRQSTFNQLSITAVRAKHKTDHELGRMLEEELEILNATNVYHGWTAAFFRGLLMADSTGRRAVLESKM